MTCRQADIKDAPSILWATLLFSLGREKQERKLNPNDGHRYLPYIVLVVDEFADLIMTAGKEVETPIARLAQLARAVGIHLIIALKDPL